MKRLDLNDSAYGTVFLKLDVLPSHMDLAYKSMSNNTDIWKLRDLCLTDKKFFSQLPDFGNDVVDAIEEYLQQYGLRLGMTMSELYAYMDARYKEKLVKQELPAVEIPLEPATKDDETESTKDDKGDGTEKGNGSNISALLVVSSFIGALAAGLTFRIIDMVVDAVLRIL